MTATMMPLTCTQLSKLVRRGGQQALEASVALVEDDRPSLTALHAVTIYCIAFSEGRWGEHTAQSPDKWATSQPGTAKNCPQLHTPLQVKALSSLCFRNTGRGISPWPENRSPGSTQPITSVSASKPELQEGPSGPASQSSMPWGHEASLRDEGCSPLYCTSVSCTTTAC